VTEPIEDEELDTGRFRRLSEAPFFQRAWKLIVLMVVVLLVAPLFTRLLNHYRAVVLEVHEDQMLVGRKDHLPLWVPAIAAPPGTVVAKQAGQWSAQTIEPGDQDAPLVDLFRRYSKKYIGRIVELHAPVVRMGAWAAVVETAGGQRIDAPLWSESLGGARVGLWLRKDFGTWEPVLIDPPANAGELIPAPGAQFAPAGQAAPAGQHAPASAALPAPAPHVAPPHNP